MILSEDAKGTEVLIVRQALAGAEKTSAREWRRTKPAQYDGGEPDRMTR